MIFKKDSNLKISWFFQLNKQKIRSQSKSQIPHDRLVLSKHKGNYFYIYSIQISESHFEFNESSSSWQTNRFLETKKQKNLGLRIYLETHRPKIVFSVASAPRLYTQRERERKRKESVWGMASPKNSLFPFSRCFSAHNNIVFSFPFSFSLSHSHSLSLTRFPHCPLKPNSKEKQTYTHKYLSLSLSLSFHLPLYWTHEKQQEK